MSPGFPYPVPLTGHELGGDDTPTDELRARALAYARGMLQGQVVVNGATGWAIAIGRRGIDKTLNHGARREHVQSLPALPELLARGDLVFSEANRDAEEARNIPVVHTLLASLTLRHVVHIGAEGEAVAAGPVTYRVRLIVKATNEGYRFYDHDLSVTPAPPDGPADSRRSVAPPVTKPAHRAGRLTFPKKGRPRRPASGPRRDEISTPPGRRARGRPGRRTCRPGPH